MLPDDEVVRAFMRKMTERIMSLGSPPRNDPESVAFRRYCGAVSALFKGARRRRRQLRAAARRRALTPS